MFLREYLTKYTKEELLDQARSFEIKKCSGLRKADLIDRIVDTFCAEEMLRSRLACSFWKKIAVYFVDFIYNKFVFFYFQNIQFFTYNYIYF